MKNVSCVWWKKAIVVNMVIAFQLAFAHITLGQIWVNSLFTDNAVIQQSQPIKIWGYDKPGNEVTCSIAGVSNSSLVAADGYWMVELENALEFNQDYELKIKSESNSRTFKGLVLGDVWVASGQSNMGWTINQSIDPTTQKVDNLDSLQADSFENLRIFRIDYKLSNREERMIDSPSWINGKWNKMLSYEDMIQYQAAVPYYTGRNLHKKLNYPIGIVVSAVGGTEIELWSPKEAESSSIANEIPTTSHFNAMISPLIPYAISGVLFYQGEANSGNPANYAEKTLACFNAWQNRWGNDFSVYTTLLAGYKWNNFSKTRNEQLLAAESLDNFFVVSAMDIGDKEDIHPYQKKALGERLANLILATHYGQENGRYLYPYIDSWTTENDSLLLNIQNHLNLKDQNQPIMDGMFKTYNSDGTSVDNSPVFLSDSVIYLNTFSEKVTRFEYNQVGYTENHIRLNGLPMHPFSSTFDNKLNYTYSYNPYSFRFSEATDCGIEQKTLIIDTLEDRQINMVNSLPDLENPCNNVLVLGLFENNLEAYPNPCYQEVYFNHQVREVALFTLNGEQIMVDEDTDHITLQIPAGLYVLQFFDKEGHSIIKKLKVN